MSKKNAIINEELKRFNLLTEYDFYAGDDDEDYVDPIERVHNDYEAEKMERKYNSDNYVQALKDTGEDEEENLVENDDDVDGGENDNPFENDDDVDGGENDNPFEKNDDDALNNSDNDNPFDNDDEIPKPEPMDDEVDIDVTELVQNTKEAKKSSDNATEKINGLLTKFNELSTHLDKMSEINTKIDNLENEIEKRNPTPEEKIEMRSLSSYPYNLKLTDYWADKDSPYNVMDDEEKNDNNEYVLTKDEVDSDYNDIHVKDSFDTHGDDEDFFNTKQITY